MMIIRPLGQKDCPVVARLHREYLRTNFSGWPGEKLLSTYYEAMTRQEGAVGYVAFDAEGQMVGYVCGVWDRRRLRLGLLKRHAFALAVFGLLECGRKPQFIWAVRKRWRDTGLPEDTDPGGYELRPIVVAKSARGSGIAKDLVQILGRDARTRGFTQLHLYTESDNVAAQRFYEKAGFVRAAHVIAKESVPMLRYVLDLES